MSATSVIRVTSTLLVAAALCSGFVAWIGLGAVEVSLRLAPESA